MRTLTLALNRSVDPILIHLKLTSQYCNVVTVQYLVIVPVVVDDGYAMVTFPDFQRHTLYFGGHVPECFPRSAHGCNGTSTVRTENTVPGTGSKISDPQTSFFPAKKIAVATCDKSRTSSRRHPSPVTSCVGGCCTSVIALLQVFVAVPVPVPVSVRTVVLGQPVEQRLRPNSPGVPALDQH